MDQKEIAEAVVEAMFKQLDTRISWERVETTIAQAIINGLADELNLDKPAPDPEPPAADDFTIFISWLDGLSSS